MILSVNHVSKAYLLDTVIKDASFHIEEREKAALVGLNGAGKTTLFKIIAGLESADAGEVVFSKGASFGYLSQHSDLISDATVFDEVLSIRQDVYELESRMEALEREMAEASLRHGDISSLLKRHAALQEKFEQENGYAIRSEVTGVLKGLGFTEEDFGQTVSSLSGGEKTRISLGKLLLTKPDILLLDEPTNHLDIHVITWLENYLLNYPGAVFVISHDRYFLDKLVTKVIDLTQGRTYVYNGNYTDYAIRKAEIFEARLKEYENQQREIRHQESVIATLRSFNREKSLKRARSREKMLAKVERIEKPVEETGEMKLRLTPNVLSGNDVLSIRNLSKKFPGHDLFEHADIEIRRGERVCVIGDNGTGKSTLLKLITGIEAPDDGELKYGSKVFIGYYDQEHQTLSDEKTVFDEISDTYPAMTNEQIRSMLGAFLFTGDDVFKRIGDLSGGEKGRVSLAKLMLSDANFLILDEPTNHLDMTSKDILENAIRSYEGTVLSVSHDRYYINETSTRIIELYHHQFVPYIGDYDYYLEKKDLFHARVDEALAREERTAESAGLQDWKKQKEDQARLRKAANDLKKAEEAVTALEEQVAAIDRQLEEPGTVSDASRLNELLTERARLANALDEAYEAWERLADS
ncbi:MAG: ABC-F family ATP-binding cassette domain-containing protein [Lachnospiraceae bacterium]|nr:ABC-F family ATP-binding cassette domain-containing protein [Lachnospiraceae bacterium]